MNGQKDEKGTASRQEMLCLGNPKRTLHWREMEYNTCLVIKLTSELGPASVSPPKPPCKILMKITVKKKKL